MLKFALQLSDTVTSLVEKTKRKASRKELRRLEIAVKKEAESALEAAAEADMGVEEQTKSRLRRQQLAEYRMAKKRVADLKKKRSRLGKKKIHERETKKQISKEIKEIMGNLKAKHEAEWKLAGFDAASEMPVVEEADMQD